MTVDDYGREPEERRAVCRSTLKAQTPVGLFNSEYVWLFDFDESGKKPISVAEFVDTQSMNVIRYKLAGAGLAAG